MNSTIESTYPIDFRKNEAEKLGNFLRSQNSVVIIGMKRVGIGNFLRFFLGHKNIVSTYVGKGVKHLFVPIDLNDLVELNIYPFWILTLKRIVDVIESKNFSEKIKRGARRYFSESIQLNDLFFTLDSVQKVISLILKAGWHPTLFLIRFDRIADAVTPEFFANLQGLRNSAKFKLSYVFTSYRPLHELRTDVFNKASLSDFSKDMYILPAHNEDLKVLLDTLSVRYRINLTSEQKKLLIKFSGGHLHYLHLAILNINEMKAIPGSEKSLFALLTENEEIKLLSEEIYEKLTSLEKKSLLAVNNGRKLSNKEKSSAQYLFDTGIVLPEGDKYKVFSPLFSYFISKLPNSKENGGEFTKKEKLLFNFLLNSVGKICEREDIIAKVWPESKEYGVTDWAIDKLIARVRKKLSASESNYEIATVFTRGYKLVPVKKSAANREKIL